MHNPLITFHLCLEGANLHRCSIAIKINCLQTIFFSFLFLSNHHHIAINRMTCM